MNFSNTFAEYCNTYGLWKRKFEIPTIEIINITQLRAILY